MPARPAKKRYSERVSEAVALVFAQELRERGLRGTRPLRAGAARTAAAPSGAWPAASAPRKWT